jgi:hypothetical protein
VEEREERDVIKLIFFLMSSFKVHKFGSSVGGKFFRGHFGHRGHFVRHSQYFWHMGKRFDSKKHTKISGQKKANPVMRHQNMGEVTESVPQRSGSSSLTQNAYRRNYDML